MHNARGYSADDPDPFTAAHRDDRSGYALHAGLGRPGVGGNGSLGYSYAVIGALSVHSSYAQDDWVRWGTQVQTDSSDLKGHEIRAAWAFSSRSNVTARLFLVGGLSSSRETRRFRIDFNRSF